MLRKSFSPLRNGIFSEQDCQTFEGNLSSSMIIINITILLILFFNIIDVVKIWDAVSAYIESYMKQSKVK
jgi:hypothetical protein